MDDQLAESAERLFRQHLTAEVHRESEEGRFPTALWDAVAEAGFDLALLPEDAGGFGASEADALGLVRIAAAHAAPIPLAETMLARRLAVLAGLEAGEGPLALGPVRRGETLSLRPEGTSWRIKGRLSRVPWGRQAVAAVVLAEGSEGTMAAIVPSQEIVATPAHNLAGEPRDMLDFDASLSAGAVAPSPIDGDRLRRAGAVIRTVQIAGALSRVLSLSVSYAQTRVQFGRAIGKFQAIQQHLAIMTGQAAAAAAAADLAVDALAGNLDLIRVAAAKARAGEAASLAAGLAHQTHGAIGFTQEYELHRLTRRLWSWRDEFGNEAEWNELVGRAVLAAGPDDLWPAISSA
jgi:acyl-CoA dehydrogenase